MRHPCIASTGSPPCTRGLRLPRPLVLQQVGFTPAYPGPAGACRYFCVLVGSLEGSSPCIRGLLLSDLLGRGWWFIPVCPDLLDVATHQISRSRFIPVCPGPAASAEGRILWMSVHPGVSGRCVGHRDFGHRGFTPAYLGSGVFANPHHWWHGVHPRLSGACLIVRRPTQAGTGSPARIRGLLSLSISGLFRHGFTPAYPGSAGLHQRLPRPLLVHPRVTGVCP